MKALEEKFELVARGLAEEGFAIVDSFLDDQEVNAILASDDFRQPLLHFAKAGIGKQHDKQINEAVRGDYIQWIDERQASLPVKVYTDRLNALLQYVNRELFLSLQGFEVHKTIYPVGSFYKRHLDQFRKDDRRKLSAICYLNPDWKTEEGGQLIIYTKDKELEVLPSAGRLVCFRSDMLEHEVRPAHRERLSITGWLLDRLDGR